MGGHIPSSINFYLLFCELTLKGFAGGAVLKNPPTNSGNAGDVCSVPELGRSPGGGNGNPFQYSCLGNPMDRGDWRLQSWRSKDLDMTERLSTCTQHLRGDE